MGSLFLFEDECFNLDFESWIHRSFCIKELCLVEM